MGKSYKAPPAPDPAAVAAAQTASNKETAEFQQRLNMVGSTGPQGTVNYVADDTQPGGYRQVTSLSPSEQATYDRSKTAENGALDTANAQLGRVNTALATPLSTDGLANLSGGYDSPQLNLSMPNTSPVQLHVNLQHGYDRGQQVQGHVGPQDLMGAYKNAADASYQQAASRLDPQYAQAQDHMEARLAAQGISQNNDAYRTASDNFARQKTDAYNQANFAAQNAGLNAENTLFGQDVAQGQFANSAAGQENAQNMNQAQFGNTAEMQSGQFYNDAANQQFQKQLARFQAENAAAAQQAGLNQQQAQFGNEARNQGLQERAYLQNQPINQFTGLLGLGQVGMPQGINYSPTQVNGTDVIGANALKVQADQANANRAAQSGGGLMGGLFSLGSAALMHSDSRLKTDIRRFGTRPDGLGVYVYRYKGQPELRFGVMAQEVRKVRPDAVVRRPDGFLAVNYMSLEAS